MALYRIKGNDGDLIPFLLKPQHGSVFEYGNNGIRMLIAGPASGVAYEDSKISDGIVSASIVLNDGNPPSSGIAFRQTDGANYLTLMLNRSGALRLFKYESGTPLQVGTTHTIAGFSNATEYELEVEFNAANIVCRLAGVDVITETSNFNQTATKHGIRLADTTAQINALAIKNLQGALTVASGQRYALIDVATIDNLPASGNRTITVLEQATMDKLFKGNVSFTDGVASTQSFSIREDSSVVVYAPDADDNTATVAYAEHKTLGPWTESPDKVYSVLVSGQSLAVGAEASEIFFPDELDAGFTFNGVPPEGIQETEVTVEDMRTLVKYKSEARETHGYGFIKLFRKLRSESSDFKPVVWSNAGVDGANITTLNDPLLPSLSNLKLYVTNSDYRAAQQMLDIEYPFILWDQGEGNANITPATYDGHLRTIQTELLTDVTKITGQASLPVLLSGIGATFFGAVNLDFDEVNNSLYQYYLNNDDAYYMGTKYYISHNYPSSDLLHFTGKGYTIQGEYYAILADRMLKSKAAGDNPPIARVLEPLTYSSSGNVITVACHVPEPPLVIDTTLVPALAGYGVVVEDGGNRITPTVTISGNNILLDIGETPASGMVIKWGDGDRGTRRQMLNIRDSQSIQSIVEGATLYNWFPCHYHTLTASEV